MATGSFFLELKGSSIKETLNRFLVDLLRRGFIDGILIPREHPSGKGIIQAFITDSDEVEKAEPIIPFMPVNSAELISDITKVSPSTRKIAAILKSCEIRAVMELSKLKHLRSCIPPSPTRLRLLC